MNRFNQKFSSLAFLVCICCLNVLGQSPAKSDKEVRKILDEQLFEPDEGMQLIQNEKFEDANVYLNDILAKDDLNKEAYFKRGVVNWELSDTVAACRDWSSVLALGDTATFMLLEAQCHSTMIIEDEIIPAKEYKKLFSAELSKKAGEDPKMAKTVVEQMPEFPGGDMALINYFKKNMQYPDEAKKKNVQGRVFVNFIISPKGKVLFPYVVRGIGAGCDEEAIRLIKNLPEWKAGKQGGKAVMVRYNLPVKFSL
ncbi:MAG TPA: energy transducer TonB [Bacteroidia bacterium]|nr:energy transducer TonB [Bacteroidia bacterium]